MGKEAEFMFTVTVGIPCWGLEEHEPLIIAFFPLFSLAGIGGDLGKSKGVIENLERLEISTRSASGNGRIQDLFIWKKFASTVRRSL